MRDGKVECYTGIGEIVGPSSIRLFRLWRKIFATVSRSQQFVVDVPKCWTGCRLQTSPRPIGRLEDFRILVYQPGFGEVEDLDKPQTLIWAIEL